MDRTDSDDHGKISPEINFKSQIHHPRGPHKSNDLNVMSECVPRLHTDHHDPLHSTTLYR
jgi:hypothetical protein